MAIITSKFTLFLNVTVKMMKNLFRSTKNLRLVFDKSLRLIERWGSKALGEKYTRLYDRCKLGSRGQVSKSLSFKIHAKYFVLTIGFCELYLKHLREARWPHG